MSISRLSTLRTERVNLELKGKLFGRRVREHFSGSSTDGKKARLASISGDRSFLAIQCQSNIFPGFGTTTSNQSWLSLLPYPISQHGL